MLTNMRKFSFCTIGALVLVLVGAQAAACQEHSVGGITAQQEFSDPRVAALAKAACTGDQASFDRAITDGADPNYEGLGGVTPLLWAVKCENPQGIEALLKAGSDPNKKIPGKFSPTYAAATMWNPAPLKLLLKYGGDPSAVYGDDINNSALAEALELGWGGHGWENYYALLDAGAEVNRADAVGNTIATKAVALGEFEKVEELLVRGYSYDLTDLGRSVTVREIDASAFPGKAAARAKVIKLLEEKGVQFPVPPRSQLLPNGRAFAFGA